MKRRAIVTGTRTRIGAFRQEHSNALDRPSGATRPPGAAVIAGLGLNQAHICSPRQHRLHGVPHKFCERNSGVIFWAEPTKSVAIAKEWLRELEKGTSKDGHDQMPLRKVLYRHRNDVYDLPARVQRRGLSHSPCEGEPLLWHAHRADRVKWARAHKHGAAEVCGFVV